MKRVSEFNTIIGAIPGALPPLMGSVAACGHLNGIGLSLFGILALWQLPHFYAIAFMYRDDYIRGGMRMLSVNDAEGHRSSGHALFWALALVPVSLAPCWFGVSVYYAVLATILNGIFVGLAVLFWLNPSRSAARRLFFGSILWLPLVLAAVVIGSYW